MIGRIATGKSFGGCIKYVLNDKLQQGHEVKPIMKDRAEVLCYNLCGGKEKELIEQFNEVRRLNPKLSKAVLHLSLSLDVNDKLEPYQKVELVEDCARELGFDKHQYVAVEHKDTAHPHLHIVINRVGFDGKTLSDSNNFKQMAKMCRKLELKYGLRQVMNPRVFMDASQRHLPRMNKRQEQLKSDIKRSLFFAESYDEFEGKMKQLNYQVIKGRGIAFRDTKDVYTKGSEVGYSLAKIQKILALHPEQKLGILYKNELANKPEIGYRIEQSLSEEIPTFRLEKSDLFAALIKPEPDGSSINSELVEDQQQQRRRRQRIH